MTPQEIFSLQLRLSTLMVETQTVMMLRLMAMGGLIPARPGENTRMITEKAPALAQGFADASQALMTGKNPGQIINAAMAPVSRKVRSNRKRLTQ